MPFYLWLVRNIWFLRPIWETAGIACPVNYRYFFFQKILGFNRSVPWPVHFTSKITGAEYIDIGINTAPGMSLGNYIFAGGEAPLYVGDYSVFASNVCVGTYNHKPSNIYEYTAKGPIVIGEYCWLGANSVVLSGVEIGPHTSVAAGAVVTKSFPDGFCILAGNPAKVIKYLDKEAVNKYQHPYRYKGYKRVS